MSSFFSVGVDASGNVFPATLTASPAAAVSGAGANLTIAPQAATTTGASGSFIVNVAAPAGATTTEAGIQLKRGSTLLGTLQGYVSNPTLSAAWYAAGVTPNGTNYSLYLSVDGTTSIVNGSSTVIMTVGSASKLTVTTSAITAATGVTFTCSSSGIINAGPLTQSGAVSGASGAPFKLGSSSAIALTNTTVTLSAAQQGTPYLFFSGTLTGAVTIALNGVPAGSIYFLDFSQVTLGANAVTITNGAGSAIATTLLTTKSLIIATCQSAALVAIG